MKDITLNSSKLSYYKKPITNTFPYRTICLLEVYSLIKGTQYQEVTKILRTIPDPNQARKYKAERFDYVTFSGTFRTRSDQNLISHSGLLCLDFDHITDIRELKANLLEIQGIETLLLFVSPSGNGLKWVVPIDLQICKHQEWFHAISSYISNTLGLDIDPTGKDLSRACFLPHDPEVYIHPQLLLIDRIPNENAEN